MHFSFIPLFLRKYTLNETYLEELGIFLSKLKNIKLLDILPYHDMAKNKYAELNIEYPISNIKPCTKEQAKYSKEIIINSYKNCLNG